MSDESLDLHRNEAVEFIRDIVRDIVENTRKKHRDLDLNKKRRVLGNQTIHFNYDEEFITAAAKNLKKKTLSPLEYSKLQNALIQVINYDNEIFIYLF